MLTAPWLAGLYRFQPVIRASRFRYLSLCGLISRDPFRPQTSGLAPDFPSQNRMTDQASPFLS
jgi:hypothetical protein